MSGIIEFKGYTFWHNVDVVEDYVWNYLENRFPDSIIFPELFGADFVVLNENIPVEIQSTVLLFSEKGTENARTIISHTQFELNIEKQIKQNVNYFGVCWFFFDSEYLRYLQNELTRKTRINLDWLYQLMKEGKVKAFTINHEGIITEISHKAFNFLNEVSMTCKVGKNEDYRILDRNKFEIISNVLKGYDFTSEELFNFKEDFIKSGQNNFNGWLQRNGSSDRESLFGMILRSCGNLEFINQILDCADDGTKLTRSNKFLLTILGLFEVKGEARGAVTSFKDKFEIANFFPGYERNKTIWNHLRTNEITLETLREIITGKIDISNVKNKKCELKRKDKEMVRETILKAHNFTDDEINGFRIEFENDNNGGGNFRIWLQKAERSDRQKFFGNILQYSTNTHLVEEFFVRKEDMSKFLLLKNTLVFLGITEAIKGGANSKLKFVDKYGLCGLFDGYETNKEFWESIKNKMLNHIDFWDLVYDRNIEQSKLIEFT